MFRRDSLLWLACVAALLSGGAVGARGLDPPPVELLHVLANTGSSAGGHAALRVGEHVFHWEVHDDGWLRLGREEWMAFSLRYGTLDNRPMRSVSLDLAPAARGQLRDTLLTLWGRQDRDLARLDALLLERRWLEQRHGGEPAEIAGGGFFDAASAGDPVGVELRNAAGAALVETERSRIETALAADTLHGVALRDALVLRAALLALSEARGLAPGALVDPEHLLPDEPPLTPDERLRLEQFGSDLEATVARLLGASRPDRGRPLLLAAARHHAVRRSLAQRRLLLLDALPSEQLVIEAVGLRRNPELIRRLGEEATENWRSLRDVVLGKPVDETRYNLLEEAATGVHELVGAPREGRGLRVRPLGRLVPSRSGTVDAIPAAPATREDVAAARTREEAFRAELAERYLYELVLRNCVTEIEALVAAEDPDFEVDSLLAFAPFELAREARASRVAGGSADLPSHRQRRVSEMAAREGRIRVALRESNVWTATAYEGSITDDPFLFFADGSPWLRPPLGVTNLFYGLGHAAFGLVRAPFDRGRLAFRGLRGAFYSVPEVFGVSIRKGRYDLLPRGAAPAPLLRAELEGRVR